MIKTELCEEEDRLVMYFEGRLDTPDADKVKKDMKELYDCHDKNIVLDLTDLKYICSAGLRDRVRRDSKVKNSRLPKDGKRRNHK